MTLYKNKIADVFAVVFMVAFMASCTLKKPATEVPMEDQENTSKSFFVDSKTNKAKTFMCAWQSEVEVGAYGESYIPHGMQIADHCNIVFDIQESALVGRLINPSFPNTPEKWEIAITIPISSHYYSEKSKDQYGRENNEVVENSSRSHWSARPNLKLNLAGLQVHKVSYSPTWGGMQVFAVSDIEWDDKNGFLAFSATTQDTYFGASKQASFRFNFKSFEHNPNFKKTPFNDANYKYMNLLHLMGEKYDGVNQLVYAAKWDLTKTHKVSLFGFPNTGEAKEIAKTVIKEWNQTFEKIGATKKGHVPFIIDENPKQKHALDLRNPTIYWVSDKRISQYSPLGVGLALADVRNGEILWGGISLYGGMIEDYIDNNLAPTAAVETGKALQKQLIERLPMKNMKAQLPSSITNATQMTSMMRTENSLDQLGQKLSSMKDNKNQVSDLAKTSLRDSSFTGKFIRDYYQVVDNMKVRTEAISATHNLTNLLGMKDLDEAVVANAANKNKTASQLAQELKQKYSGMNRDLDRNFANTASEWGPAMARANVPRDKALRTVIKELISHEYGHFLGLGHQFKENILPLKGTVPDSIRDKLVSRSSKEAGMRQSTSIMGYRHPLAEFVTPFEEIIPGPHDELVLRYLYKLEVATYTKGDADFKYHQMDANSDGLIPEKIGNELVTYFPQCNDMVASLSVDPFCNRFDRGSSAQEIVENYIMSFKDNIVQSHFAFGDSRKVSVEQKEAYVFYKAITQLARVRLFYDYMRHSYKKVFEDLSKDVSALMDFSNTCKGSTQNEKVKAYLDKYPGLQDLCLANLKAIEGYSDLLALPISDFTKVDIDNNYMPGGMDAGDIDRDYSKMFGSWTEAGALSLKLVSLYGLLSPNPWLLWYGYMFTVPNYDNPDHRYSYASIYPIEYTKVISDTITKNLKFASNGDSDRTTMGRAVVMAGMLASEQMSSNDNNRFPDDYLRKIRSQTEFDFTIEAIIITKTASSAEKVNVKQFTGVVYDMNSRKETPLSEVYLLPNGYVFAFDNKSFVLPLRQIKFVDDNTAITFAIRIEFSKDDESAISDSGAKRSLQELHRQVINSCLDGTPGPDGKYNGLRNYFKESFDDFDGFYMPPNLSQETDKYKMFIESIDTAYKKYYNSPRFAKNAPSITQCAEALRGVGMLVGTSAVMSGFFTQQLIDSLEK